MPHLTIQIFLPLAGALALYLVPRASAWRWVGAGASGLALGWGALLALLFDHERAGSFQFEERATWIPSIGASYHVGLDGLSLALVLLTLVLTFVALLYEGTDRTRPRAFYASFLVMESALLGQFCTRDLLLFYLFWEASLVPMYFIIGVWGHQRRRAAALKFFLYTRVGGLALLLGILGLYVATTPRTFELSELVAAQPFAGSVTRGGAVLLALLVAFGIKLPIVPLHTWLPDAHTEAPTGGSVLLAGVLLKMGGYGLLRIALPAVPEAISRWSPYLAAIGVGSALYGAAVALAQTDLKRMVALSSVNHMGYVLLGVAVAGARWADPTVRSAAYTGAGYQLVAHGVVTGALFLLVGILAKRTGTREIGSLSGMWRALPGQGALFALAMLAALGLPALANFAAEFQVLLGALAVYWPAALVMILSILVTTGMFVWTLQRVLMGAPRPEWRSLPGMSRREWASALVLSALIVALGILPNPLTRLLEATGAQRAVSALIGAR